MACLRKPLPTAAGPVLTAFPAITPQEWARGLMTYMPMPGDATTRTVTLVPGDGVGPEVTNAVVQVVEALKAPVVWER
jgi:isocitrate dehydrogenase (NAD+)